MIKHLLGKNVGVFPQNSTFLLQILMAILKIDVTLKSFLAIQLLSYLVASKFSLILCLLLNSSINKSDNSGYYFI